MGTTAQKLEYLGTTKSQLKDQINYGLPTEKQITSSTTFRNYVGSIFEAFLEALRTPDTLFNNLPKTSGSGSNITLNNTAYAPMRITLNPTAISQTTYTGKNKCSSAWYESSNTARFVIDKTNLQQTFTLSYISDVTAPNGTVYLFIDSVNRGSLNVSIKQTANTREYVSISIGNSLWEEIQSSTSLWITTYVNNAGHTGLNTITQAQIENGSSMTAYEPYVGGTASPNPSYPQDIHTISGNNSVVVEGKNLFNKSTIESGKEISNGTIYNNSSWCVSDYIVVEYNQTYIKNINNGNDCIIYDKDKNKISTNDRRFASNKITITEQNAKYIRVNLPLTSLDTYQLEIGTSSTTYTPYVSQTNPINLGEYELGTIGNYSNEFVRSGGEQLFDIGTSNSDYDNLNNASPSYLTINGNTLSMVIQSGGGTRFYRKQNLVGNDTFTINSTTSTNEARYFVRIRKIDNSGWLSSSDYTFTDGWTYNQYYGGWYTNIKNGNNTKTFTIPNCLYWQIGFGWDTNVYEGTTQTMSNIMLNKGTTALPYVPYEKGWYYKQGIGKVVLDGSETYARGFRNKTDYFGIAITNGVENPYWGGNNYKNNLFSDKLVCHSFAELYNINNEYEGVCLDTANAFPNVPFVIMLAKSRLSEATIDGVKEWLSNNNITIYYQKSTPTYTKITGELANQLEQVYKGMLSYDGTTNISQVNNDLAFELVGSAITKLS